MKTGPSYFFFEYSGLFRETGLSRLFAVFRCFDEMWKRESFLHQEFYMINMYLYFFFTSITYMPLS